jgi:hypothetical protein
MESPQGETAPVVTITAAPEVELQTAPASGRLAARLASARREDGTVNGLTIDNGPATLARALVDFEANSNSAQRLPLGPPPQGPPLVSPAPPFERPPPPQEKQPAPPAGQSTWQQFWLFVAWARMHLDTPVGRRLITFGSRCLMALDTVRVGRRACGEARAWDGRDST